MPLIQPTRPSVDPLAVSLGYVNVGPGYFSATTTGAPSTQLIYAGGIWLPPNKVCTNIHLHVITAATGTAPTGFFVGLASGTKMLAQSSNLAASAQLTAVGTATLALSAPYTSNLVDSANGNYYIVVLMNGTFGTTNVQFGRAAFAAGNGAGLSGQSPFFGGLGSGQTALAANGAAITFGQTTGSYWAGAVS